MSALQMPFSSRRRLPVADVFGMGWEKKECRQIRPFSGNIVVGEPTQDISTGIANFSQFFYKSTSGAFCIYKTVWPKGPTAVRERVKVLTGPHKNVFKRSKYVF